MAHSAAFNVELTTHGGPACITLRRKADGAWVGTVTAPNAEDAVQAAHTLMDAATARWTGGGPCRSGAGA